MISFIIQGLRGSDFSLRSSILSWVSQSFMILLRCEKGWNWLWLGISFVTISLSTLAWKLEYKIIIEVQRPIDNASFDTKLVDHFSREILLKISEAQWRFEVFGIFASKWYKFPRAPRNLQRLSADQIIDKCGLKWYQKKRKDWATVFIRCLWNHFVSFIHWYYKFLTKTTDIRLSWNTSAQHFENLPWSQLLQKTSCKGFRAQSKGFRFDQQVKRCD